MSKTKVNKKMLRQSKIEVSVGWIQLAEDAEQDAEKARLRNKQLSEAARIFRQNAESGTPFPLESATRN
jgi:hypothetical protein